MVLEVLVVASEEFESQNEFKKGLEEPVSIDLSCVLLP